MGDRYDRERELQGRVYRAALIANRTDIERLRTDTVLRLQMETMRRFLSLADKAMEAEGVPLESRDRIVHWIICGQPAPRWDPDPEVELDEAVRRRADEQDAWIRHLEKLPIDVLPLLGEE